jgi:Raf kinase inhibitor-like YbhB/YbcL family protein
MERRFVVKTSFEERFPVKYTCDGENISPELSWSGAPKCKSFALVVEDPDAPSGTFIHWVLYNIPATVNSLPPKLAKRETLEGYGSQGVNDFGETGYDGPCPPRGHGDHRYYFRLYALSEQTSFAPRLTAKQLKEKIAPLILATAEFMAKYARK